MLKIKVLCVGRLKEKYLLDAQAEYVKRLSGYCRLEIQELPEYRLPENPAPAEIENALAKEAEAVAAKLPKGSVLISLCIEGETPDSVQLAERIEKLAVSGADSFCFVIGGSYGLHEDIKKRTQRLSMSKMTFPHHLARIMLLEQLYRSFKINEGSKYHK